MTKAMLVAEDDMGMTLCLDGVHLEISFTCDEYYKESQPWRGGTNRKIICRPTELCDGQHTLNVEENIVKLVERFKSTGVKEEIVLDDFPRRPDQG